MSVSAFQSTYWCGPLLSYVSECICLYPLYIRRCFLSQLCWILPQSMIQSDLRHIIWSGTCLYNAVIQNDKMQTLNKPNRYNDCLTKYSFLMFVLFWYNNKLLNIHLTTWLIFFICICRNIMAKALLTASMCVNFVFINCGLKLFLPMYTTFQKFE